MDKTTQEKLVLITFLIAVFFLGQYLWERIPRYKWQERIDTYDKIENDKVGRIVYERRGNVIYGVNESKYDYCEDYGEIVVCYIKEKVRIN